MAGVLRTAMEVVMSALRQRLLEDLRIAGYAERTVETYVGAVSAFATYSAKRPDHCDHDDIRRWVVHLQAKGSSPMTIRLYLSALKFLYVRTLRRPEVMADIRLPKAARALPIVLSAAEVISVLDALETPRMRMFFTLVYATGLRLREACALQTSDIQKDRGVIHVRHGKGGRDRFVTLIQNRTLLRSYYAEFRPAPPWLFSARAAAASTRRSRQSHRRGETRRGHQKRSPPTRFAIRSQRTCWRTARTCG
jgi:site-specific recombinase XerD